MKKKKKKKYYPEAHKKYNQQFKSPHREAGISLRDLVTKGRVKGNG